MQEYYPNLIRVNGLRETCVRKPEYRGLTTSVTVRLAPSSGRTSQL